MPAQILSSVSELRKRINLGLILDELLLFLRNNITDRRNRTLFATDVYVGDDNTTTFTFTQDMDSKLRHKVMNVKSVTVDGISQTAFTDYMVGYRNDSPILGKIQFWNPPANAKAISVYYGHTYHFIFAEAPRIDLTTRNYPRLSLQVDGKPEDAAVGGKVTRMNISVKITVVDDTRNQVEQTVQQIKNLFADESVKKGFISFRYIYVSDVSGVEAATEDPNDTVYGCQIELSIPFEFEFSK